MFVFFGSLPTGEVEVKAEPAVVESDVSARAEADAKAATAVDAEAEAEAGAEKAGEAEVREECDCIMVE